MPRPEVNLDRLRPEIEQRIILRKQSHKEVLAWLAIQGIVINRKTLQRRIIQWGISRHGPAACETAVASVISPAGQTNCIIQLPIDAGAFRLMSTCYLS